MIFVLAYLLLIGVGLWCRRNLPAKTWASNNRPTELSAFTIGRQMLNHQRLSIRRALIELLAT